VAPRVRPLAFQPKPVRAVWGQPQAVRAVERKQQSRLWAASGSTSGTEQVRFFARCHQLARGRADWRQPSSDRGRAGWR